MFHLKKGFAKLHKKKDKLKCLSFFMISF